MSKGLTRVRSLISEIDSIQTQGRKASTMIPLVQAVQSEYQEGSAAQSATPPEMDPVATRVQKSEPESRVFMQLTGKIALQLQLENTDETVQVRHCGETIEIRFNDGKAIHLPIKGVA